MKRMMKLSPTTMVLGGVGAAALLYMIFKPKDAAAAPAPGPGPGPGPGPSGATQTCPGGQVILATAQCPPAEPKTKICADKSVVSVNSKCPEEMNPQFKKCPDGKTVPFNAQCPGPPSSCSASPTSSNTAPVPNILVTASGLGQPAKEIIAPFGLSALPVSIVDDACVTSPTDGLIYLQAWKMDFLAGKYMPIFQDPGPTPVVAIAVTDAQGPGTAKAADANLVMMTKTSFVSNYFDPKITPKVAEMEMPGSFVLIWSADRNGIAIAWWLTIWTSPNTVIP